MKKAIILLLVAGNLIALSLLLDHSNRTGAQAIELSDLAYGKIDVDGDGKYTQGDDSVFQWILENAPERIDRALESASINEDGGVDLSSYLLGFEGPK